LVFSDNFLAGPRGIVRTLRRRVTPGLQDPAHRPAGFCQGPRRIVHEAWLEVLQLPAGVTDGQVVPARKYGLDLLNLLAFEVPVQGLLTLPNGLPLLALGRDADPFLARSHAEEHLGLQWEDADFDRGTIRHTVSGSVVAQHSRHRCVVLRLAYFLPVVRNGKRSSVFGIIG
jgi:hypothetical protein